jgi:hypothetical protein
MDHRLAQALFFEECRRVERGSYLNTPGATERQAAPLL